MTAQGFSMIWRRLLWALLLIPSLWLTGCADALIYGERTSFNLGIGVHEDAALPLNVNIGFRRGVVNSAPPLGGDVTEGKTPVARGEPVSSTSSFNLTDNGRETNPFGGTLRIKTLFASGEAAVTIASKPGAVAFILSGAYSNAPTAVRMKAFLGDPINPDNVNK